MTAASQGMSDDKVHSVATLQAVERRVGSEAAWLAMRAGIAVATASSSSTPLLVEEETAKTERDIKLMSRILE